MESSRPAFRQLMAELARARQAVERGAIDEARAAIEAALAIDPENLQALEFREQLNRRGGSWNARPAERAGRPKPGSPPAREHGNVPAPSATDPRTGAGWSNFEGRVRERRAARCVDTARNALARGDAPAARDAIAELGTLVPAHPELGRLRHLCVSCESTPEPSDARQSSPARPSSRRIEDRPFVEAPAREERSPTAEPDPPTPHEPLAPFVSEAAAPDLSLGSPVYAPSRTREAGPPRRRHRMALAAAAAVLVLGILIPAGQWRLSELRSDDVIEVASVDEPLESRMPALPDSTPPPAAEETEAALAQDSLLDSPVMTSGDEAPAVEDSSIREPENTVAEVEIAAVSPPRSGAPPEDAPPPAPQPRPEAPREPRRAAATADTSAPEPVSAPEPAPARPAVLSTAAASAPAPPAASVPERALDAGNATARLEPPPPLPSSSTAAPAASAAYVAPSSPLSQPAAPPAEPGGEAAVRDVLQRYVAAYNRLDATAARAVWPAVDQGALQRAFAQLDSQTLRFENCDISVEDAGGTATCNGQARWVPRVGGRDAKREPRTWRFELARNGEEWIITRAEARR